MHNVGPLLHLFCASCTDIPSGVDVAGSLLGTPDARRTRVLRPNISSVKYNVKRSSCMSCLDCQLQGLMHEPHTPIGEADFNPLPRPQALNLKFRTTTQLNLNYEPTSSRRSPKIPKCSPSPRLARAEASKR